jgi:hypothetical protein
MGQSFSTGLLIGVYRFHFLLSPMSNNLSIIELESAYINNNSIILRQAVGFLRNATEIKDRNENSESS